MASGLRVTTRTLRNWKKNCNSEPKKPGPIKTWATFDELSEITREWDAQGCPGSRPVISALPEMRVRLIQVVVAALKFKKRKRSERRILQSRESIVVHEVGTMTAMDAAALKKGEDFIVCRERKSLITNTTDCNGAQDSDDTIGVLDGLKEDGRLPLVVCTDNGSPFVSEKVKTYLSQNKVIHLKSLPYTPQQNASAENGVKEVKELARDGKTRKEACTILNYKRRRMKLNYKTANQVEQENPVLVTGEYRALFFETTSAAIKTAVLGIECALELRKAERKAIFDTLESFSLITINRGLRHA